MGSSAPNTGPRARNACCARRTGRAAGGLLVAAATPKLCCLMPLLIAAYPALARSVSLFGIGTAFAEFETLCTQGRVEALAWLGPLDLPLAVALGAFASGLALVLFCSLRHPRPLAGSLPPRAGPPPAPRARKA